MQPPSYTFEAKVWLWSGNSGWHFVTLPAQLSQEIKQMFGYLQAGWGSVRVKVRVGKTSWETSIFFGSKEQTYILPLKSKVRMTENIQEGTEVEVVLEIKV